jgi:hypothetical protein
MLRSWTQLELSGLDAAEKALQPLGAVNGFEPLYQLQLGLLSDKAGKTTEAAELCQGHATRQEVPHGGDRGHSSPPGQEERGPPSTTASIRATPTTS